MRSGRKWSLFLEMVSAHWEVGIWQSMLPWGKAELFGIVDVAIQLLDKQIDILKRANADEPARQLSEYKEFLRYKRSKDQTKED